MSKQAEADLILKLYELRREATMRQARNWYFQEFHPETFAEYKDTVFGPHGAHLRMVVSYWDMAASLVNHGTIGCDFFNDANGEHWGVFAKIEPILSEIRAMYGPQFLSNLERLIDDTPGGRLRTAAVRERMKSMKAEMTARQATAAV
jgi:hypothetical protein